MVGAPSPASLGLVVAAAAAAAGLVVGAALAATASSVKRGRARRRKTVRQGDGETWQGHRPAIVCIGDSLTQHGDGAVPTAIGWTAQMRSTYVRRADVINRGFSGYTSRLVAAILDDVFRGLPDPDDVYAVVLWLGANDATRPDHVQHVPPSEFLTSMRALAERLRGRFPKAHVLIAGPPPVDAEAWDKHCRASGSDDGGGRCNRLVRVYAGLCRQVAAEAGCTFVDLYSEFVHRADGVAGIGRFLSDGLHLSQAGNDLVAEVLTSALAGMSGAPGDLPLHFPSWMAAPGALRST